MNSLLNYKPPRIAIVLMAVSGAVGYVSPPGTILFLPYIFLGAVVGVAGFVVLMWAWLRFRKANTAVCPTSENDILVSSGPYRFTRNPMYLGMLCMLLGLASLSDNPVPFIAPTTFFLIIDKVFIPYEEEKMGKTFGSDYEEFKSKTRRWL